MSLGPGFSLYRDRDQFYFKTEEGIHSGQDSVRMISEPEAWEGVESEDLSIRVGAFGHQFFDKRLQADLSALRFPLTLRPRSEEHTSELQSRGHLVCRLLLEK